MNVELSGYPLAALVVTVFLLVVRGMVALVHDIARWVSVERKRRRGLAPAFRSGTKVTVRFGGKDYVGEYVADATPRGISMVTIREISGVPIRVMTRHVSVVKRGRTSSDALAGDDRG